MRIAAIADVHGNLKALEAVLAHIDTFSPDTVVNWVTLSLVHSIQLEAQTRKWAWIATPLRVTTSGSCLREPQVFQMLSLDLASATRTSTG